MSPTNNVLGMFINFGDTLTFVEYFHLTIGHIDANLKSALSNKGFSMKKFLIIGLLTLLPTLTGCDSSKDQNSIRAAQILVPVDYGNGVYYLPSTRAEFGKSLAHFIADHKGLELITMAPNGTGGYGVTVGYFAVFREKK